MSPHHVTACHVDLLDKEHTRDDRPVSPIFIERSRVFGTGNIGTVADSVIAHRDAAATREQRQDQK